MASFGGLDDARLLPLTVGTDAPLVAYGSGLHDELKQYAKAGFSPAAILRFATINNADYLGQADSLGRVAPNFYADLILVCEIRCKTLRPCARRCGSW
ncbi:MAG TPA: amidohydrolase family protein [Candidatus Methylomirabilis sp.]|nr:amidohydrolase family protein [Candidatus Methylomirabilis sp.]